METNRGNDEYGRGRVGTGGRFPTEWTIGVVTGTCRKGRPCVGGPDTSAGRPDSGGRGRASGVGPLLAPVESTTDKTVV